MTSNKTIFSESPENTPPWIAAPIATTSSGFTLLLGSFPNISLTNSWTFGILVDPPTKIISSISEGLKLESFIAFLHGSMVLLTKSLIKFKDFIFENFLLNFLIITKSTLYFEK